MHKPFSIREALRFGWRKVDAHSALVFQVGLTFFGIVFLQALISRISYDDGFGSPLTGFLSIVQFVFGIGINIIALKLAKGEQTSYADLLPTFGIIMRYIGAYILVGLCALFSLLIPGVLAFVAVSTGTLVGFLIALVLGVIAVVLVAYVALRFYFVQFAVISGKSPSEALAASTEATEGNKWKLLLFMITVIGINILGAAAFLAGLLVTVPITTIASAHLYTRLASKD